MKATPLYQKDDRPFGRSRWSLIIPTVPYVWGLLSLVSPHITARASPFSVPVKSCINTRPPHFGPTFLLLFGSFATVTNQVPTAQGG